MPDVVAAPADPAIAAQAASVAAAVAKANAGASPAPAAAAAPAAPATTSPAAPATGAAAVPVPAAQPQDPAKPAAIEVKLPEGAKIDQKALGKFTTILSDEKLSPQQRAQSLIDLQFRLMADSQKQIEQTIAQQKTADLEALKADPTYGGGRLDKTRAEARDVMQAFFGENGSKLIEAYGLDCHPDFAIPLAKIRAVLSEDTIKGTVKVPPADPADPVAQHKAMFPKSYEQMVAMSPKRR